MTRFLIGLSFALLALAPRRADACSPLPPGVSGTIPLAGGTHPANAPIVLQGTSLTLEKLTATIDGVATTLSPASTLANSGLTVLLTPAQPGQKVAIKGPVCAQGSPDIDGCTLDLSFTAAAADTAPPGAIDSLSFDVFDYADVEGGGGSCIQSSELVVYTRIASQDATAATPEYWLVDGYDSATGKDLLFSGVYGRSSASQVLPVTLNVSALQGVSLPAGFCLEVTGFDLAGNKGTPVRQCSPCRFRDENKGPKQSYAPDAPTWTAADVVAGGSCDTSGAGGSGQAGSGQAGSGQAGSGQAGGGQAGSTGGTSGVSEESSGSDGGCAVSGGGPGAGGSALAALAALTLVRRRRGR